MPSVTRALAPIRQLRPMTAPFSTTAFMPTRLPSPIVQPCSIALCPTVTFSPIVIGKPASTCSTAPSWTLLPAPIVIRSLSPRTTALNQTLTSSASVTSPMTAAPGATNVRIAARGATPSSE